MGNERTQSMMGLQLVQLPDQNLMSGHHLLHVYLTGAIS